MPFLSLAIHLLLSFAGAKITELLNLGQAPGFWAVFLLAPMYSLAITTRIQLLYDSDAQERDFQLRMAEIKLKQPEKVYHELPPDEPKTPVFLPRNDGFVQREIVDFPELVRLARILKAGNYSIRARNKKLEGEYDSIRQMFGQLDGVTNTNNNKMNLTKYGKGLVDDLAALSPIQIENPPKRVFHRVTQHQHAHPTQERM